MQFAKKEKKKNKIPHQEKLFKRNVKYIKLQYAQVYNTIDVF